MDWGVPVNEGGAHGYQIRPERRRSHNGTLRMWLPVKPLGRQYTSVLHVLRTQWARTIGLAYRVYGGITAFWGAERP